MSSYSSGQSIPIGPDDDDAEPGIASGPDSRDTALRLLDAADEVFAESGFAGATTAAIAERAGVTKALVHYYYRNKETLHRAVLERYKDRVSSLLLEDLDRRAPEDALTVCIRRYCSFLARHPRYVRLIQYNALEDTCELSKLPMFRRLIEETTAALERGMRLGVFRQIDARRLLVSIDALCSYYFEHEKEIRKLWDLDANDHDHSVNDHIEHVIELLMHAICTNHVVRGDR
ncbi:MAG: TetR/AcrR family transcriptional regulator [Candidatus Eiseniibacteriota bacterium]|jgi:TetR/AcrR family transcriptional regulator